MRLGRAMGEAQGVHYETRDDHSPEETIGAKTTKTIVR